MSEPTTIEVAADDGAIVLHESGEMTMHLPKREIDGAASSVMIDLAILGTLVAKRSDGGEFQRIYTELCQIWFSHLTSEQDEP